MKNNIVLTGLLGCGLLASNLAGAAPGNNNGNNNSIDRQSYNAKFTLTATPDAPPGAKGTAQVRSLSQDGDTTASLSLQTQGLEPGDYMVTAVRTSDAGEMTLGQFTIDEPTNGRGRGKLKSISALDLTPDIDASDLGELTVSDGSGTALLTGNLGEAGGKSSATLDATVPITGGEAAPDATGFAKLKSSIKKGQQKSRFMLLASGVPASSTFAVDVDGTDAGTVTSNKQGKVLVKKLPAEITSIGTVRLLDENGLEVLRAEF